MIESEKIEIVCNTILWEKVGQQVEQLEQLPIMVREVGYIEQLDEMVEQINECEILDTDSFDVLEIEESEDKLSVTFEMPFVLSAWADKKQLLSIHGMAEGKCSIPQKELVDLDYMKLEDMHKAELLKLGECVEVNELKYAWIECMKVKE